MIDPSSSPSPSDPSGSFFFPPNDKPSIASSDNDVNHSPFFKAYLESKGMSPTMSLSEFLNNEAETWKMMDVKIKDECKDTVKHIFDILSKCEYIAPPAIVEEVKVSKEEHDALTYKVVDTIYDTIDANEPAFFTDIYTDRVEIEGIARKVIGSDLMKIIEWQKQFRLMSFDNFDYIAKTKLFLDGFHVDRTVRISEAATILKPEKCADGMSTDWRLYEIKGWFAMGRFDMCKEVAKKLPADTLKHIFWVRFFYALSIVDMFFKRRKREKGMKIPYEVKSYEEETI
jgi:hypothetical protein